MPELSKPLKLRLKTFAKVAVKLRRAMDCARFVHNPLRYERDFACRDYLDEIKSRQCCGEALSRNEAAARCVRPEAVSKFCFNYCLRQLKKHYSFLAADAHSPVLQHECRKLCRSVATFFAGKRSAIRVLNAKVKLRAYDIRSSCALL